MNVIFGADGGFAAYSGTKPQILKGNVKIENKSKYSKKRAQKTNNIQVFNDLANFSPDEFWKTFLENCSKGFLPKRYKFNNPNLIYKYHNSTKSIKLDSPSSLKDFIALKEFLFECSSIESPEDEAIRLEVNKNMDSTPPELSWSKIKMSPPKMNAAVGAYISKIKDANNLSHSDFEILFNALKSMISANMFQKTDFIYEKGELKEIKGLIFDSQLRKFVIKKLNPPPKEVIFRGNNSIFSADTSTNLSQFSQSSELNTSVKTFLDEWNNFLFKTCGN